MKLSKWNSRIGIGQKKEKHLTKPEVGHFRAQGIPLKRKLKEFPVTEDALLPVGTPITVRHFVPGQHVDVIGITRGKGFQGGMKRWGFKGMPASHGTSLTHRNIGSTGQRDAPGKVNRRGDRRLAQAAVRVPRRRLVSISGEDDRMARRLRRASLNLGFQELAKKNTPTDAGDNFSSN
ncbi:50S ribosomal protein L3-2, chloroplastic-like isoform X3 [Asparagus officinalis]|uniref:50S ribosomal protein L3-2, chloroplastic-like isoform X3 n=1 Tax=Asparagus officinalis TaxID=4686 RepID=UPI00098DF437|nr:50S ribosomal protein L3-2, chloroplastic-like isoform X3 [Asparagus officinalis]